MNIQSSRGDAAPLPPPPRLGAAARYLELTAAFARRDLQVRYRQTLLGFLWAFGQPVVFVLLLTPVFAGVFRDLVPHYDLYVLSGMIPWLFAANALTIAVSSLSGNAALLTKVRFPRTALPVAAVFALWPDFLIGWLLGLVMAAWRGVPIAVSLIGVPLIGILQTLFLIGLALALASSNARWRDVRYALPLLLQVWMLGSPILYPLAVVENPDVRSILAWNPLVPFLDGYRDLLVHGRFPASFAAMSAFTAGSFAAGIWIFRRHEPTLADIV